MTHSEFVRYFVPATMTLYDRVGAFTLYEMDDVLGYPAFHEWVNKYVEGNNRELPEWVLNKLKFLCGPHGRTMRKIMEARNDMGGS